MVGKNIKYAVLGVVSGALSWAICGWFFGQFEPYDTHAGLACGQIIMIFGTLYTVYRGNFVSLIIFIIGSYAGVNIYPFILGTSEQRAWISLGLIVSPVLIILPFLCGLGFMGIESMIRKATRTADDYE